MNARSRSVLWFRFAPAALLLLLIRAAPSMAHLNEENIPAQETAVTPAAAATPAANAATSAASPAPLPLGAVQAVPDTGGASAGVAGIGAGAELVGAGR